MCVQGRIPWTSQSAPILKRGQDHGEVLGQGTGELMVIAFPLWFLINYTSSGVAAVVVTTAVMMMMMMLVMALMTMMVSHNSVARVDAKPITSNGYLTVLLLFQLQY